MQQASYIKNTLYALSIVILTAAIFITPTHALPSVGEPCNDVEVIFARGSGQKLRDPEAKRFLEQLDSRIPNTAISLGFYELGTESYGGLQYPAINVSDWTNGNGIGAWLSAGNGNDYGKSVKDGVGELKNYLTQRHTKCKATGTQYVLGGYSQGAQVIGQALPDLSTDIRKDVVFAALFGDPKLYLPEGEGRNPPACQGKDISPWSRIFGTANCKLHKGSLGARKPYLPSDMRTKTGLWCNGEDFVCGTSKSLSNSPGHGRYALNGHGIDIAVSEIITRLATTLPADQAGHLVRMEGVGAGSNDLDIAFILDTTGSMSGQIEDSKAFIRASAEKIKQLNGRIALTVYKDRGDEYTAKVVAGLSSDTTQLLAALDSVYAYGGGDEPEAALHALTTTFNTLDWKDGATKATILLTDASYHDPDPVDGSTLASVTQRSLEIDPVNVYPVVPNYMADFYQPLANQTAGQVIVDTGDTVAALTTALTKIEQRPVVTLQNSAYTALVGQEITFDASKSYVVDASITQYDWDFDGDGIFDRTTTEPRTDYTYLNDFDGNMQVRATASNNTVASASATILISASLPPINLPPAPTNLTITQTPVTSADATRTVTLNWTSPAESSTTRWVIALNGIGLGILDSNRTSIEIRDVLFDEATFTVTGIDSDDMLGDEASVTLAAYVTPQPPTTPAASPLSWLKKMIKTAVKIIIWIWRL